MSDHGFKFRIIYTRFFSSFVFDYSCISQGCMAVQPHKKLEKGHENTGNLRSDMERFGVLFHNSQRNWFVTLYIYNFLT